LLQILRLIIICKKVVNVLIKGFSFTLNNIYEETFKQPFFGKNYCFYFFEKLCFNYADTKKKAFLPEYYNRIFILFPLEKLDKD